MEMENNKIELPNGYYLLRRNDEGITTYGFCYSLHKPDGSELFDSDLRLEKPDALEFAAAMKAE